MEPRYDIKLNSLGACIIQDNDVVWAESDQQHIQDTINAAPGWWKEHFEDGVNVLSYLNSDGQQQKLAREIKIQLQKDLYTVNNPIVKFEANGKLTIQPNATI